MRDDIVYWLALSRVPGVGSVLFQRLLAKFGKPEKVFQAPGKALLEVEGVGETIAEQIRKGPFEKEGEKELYLLGRLGGHLLTIEDDGYPDRLRSTYDPPSLVYVRGDIRREDALAVSIVGSRKTSSYGRAFAERLGRDLAHRGVTIVSGLARGIDSAAHRGALSGGGRTVAVLGCGVDVIYPPENRALFEEIIRQGAVVSEFPIGTPPEASHFPRRNRIISGLSMGVVVVEAGSQSGSLITAGYALEQGREVFAVPGFVGSSTSRGTHKLIKQGAKLVESSEDILEEILPQWQNVETLSRATRDPGEDLQGEERVLYEVLAEVPIHIDAVIRETGLEARKVMSQLLDLELRGLVVQWPGKCFSRKTRVTCPADHASSRQPETRRSSQRRERKI